MKLDLLQHRLTEIHLSRTCQAAACSLQDEVDGICKLVAGVASGRGPSCVSKLSDLAKVVLKRLEESFTIDAIVHVDTSPTGLPFTVSKLAGVAAIRHLYDSIKASVDDNPSELTLPQIRPLRVFKWLLDASQCKEVQSWIRLATSNVLPGFKKALTAGGDVDMAIVSASAAPAASGDDASLFSAHAGKEPLSKKAKTIAKREQQADDDVMQFFKSKSRTELA